MVSKINYNSIIDESIVDGPGLRFVLFTQGCPHHCPGCHNPQTHAFETCHLASPEDMFLQYKGNPLLSGITLSGGEPFCQAKPLAQLASLVKEAGGNVITYTGYTLEALLSLSESDPDISELLAVTDYLIDGPFIEAQKDLLLSFRGSRNQRIWDMRTRTTVDEL